MLLFLTNLQSFRFISPKFPSFPHFSFLQTRLLPPPHKAKPNTNPNTTFHLKNPLLSLLQRCNSINHLKQIQAQMTVTGLVLDTFAASRLIVFCASFDLSSLEYCRTILTHIENPSTFMWNVAIRGFLEVDNLKDGVLLYKQMLVMGSRPDNYTYPLLFKACAHLLGIWTGVAILGHVLHLCFDSDVFVNNAIIHMFVVWGELETAHQVFDRSCVKDLVSWNSLINGYVHKGRPIDALKLFKEMEGKEIKPDQVTMIGVISSCAQLEDLELGREFHHYVEENRMKLTVALRNVLMDMYVKCGDLDTARLLFDNMPERTVISWTTMVAGLVKFGLLDDARRYFDEIPDKDVVLWNAMISGYVQHNRARDALALFHEMQATGIMPNEAILVGLLCLCSQLGALDLGQWVHQYIKKHKIPLTVALGTTLVDMYAKCGNIEKSLGVFREIREKNTLTWTAMIGGLAIHGHGHVAIEHFSEMIATGLRPDEVTFVEVLSACCHAGLVDQGHRFLTEMSFKYNLPPKLKHYSCMVDLLGRAGLLDEAEKLIRTMPMKPDATIWGALFFACRIHGNVSMGERAASQLLQLDPSDSGIYVLLANMYVEANMWREAGKKDLRWADFMDSNMPTWRMIASIFGNYIDWDIPSNHGPDDDDEKDENIVQQAPEEAAL
ncbi:hypothetical protein MRB53_023094 [Persea americana]|uniref:Uncharacterized protein n=1 Tax=Persea americana TaxID=3435 RepID=A0ACC2L8F4_PERAE|nr:hypothetical protein MRB53_023094 [Persea americana]